MDRDETLTDLVLATIFMSSWQEDLAGRKISRAWKGYPFEILDSLAEAGLISSTRRSKSLTITDEGIEKAKHLIETFAARMRP